MGQILVIGLRISAAISKENVEKHLGGKQVDDILGQIETRYRLADIYERSEEERYVTRHTKRVMM